LRTVKRNKRPVAYAFYNGVTELRDDDGNLSGEYEVSYTEPVKTLMNVSGGRGQADIALFGLTQTFARTATTEDLTTPFNTQTVFWVETDPDTEPFDYRVVAVSRTINQVVLALAEVEVNTAPQQEPQTQPIDPVVQPPDAEIPPGPWYDQ
jgi:hypothetical protein